VNRICLALAVPMWGASLGLGVAAVASGQSATTLAGYDFRSDDVRHVELPGRLDEISGLALDARGRLWAHDDERATVYRIDPASGDITASFHIGRNGARGDLEGIALAGSRFFLITSNGHLIESAEGRDGETVDFTNVDIGSKDLCDDIEGLEYDPPGNALLLACKSPDGRELRDHIVVLRFSLRTRTLDPEPLLAVTFAALEPFGLDDAFSPSGIAIHPVTGTLLLIAARERAIVEIDRAGRVLAAASLRNRYHEQAEGIAVTSDGTLIIADEGAGGDATLTFYAYRPRAGGQ
jgi:uncharacterized protein YjiK